MLSQLPSELLLYIVDHIQDISSFNALCQINRGFHTLLNPSLYKRDADYRGSSALLWGDRSQMLSTVAMSIKAGGDRATCVLRTAGRDMQSLHLASAVGNEDIVRMLLAEGFDPNVSHYPACRPSEYAIFGGWEKIACLLVEYGAGIGYVNYPFDRYAAYLHLASYFGLSNLVELLLSRGVDVDATDRFGNTPLHYAVMPYHICDIRVLIFRKAKDRQSLYCRCRSKVKEDAIRWRSNEETISMLCHHGAKTQTRNLDGDYPRDLASRHKNSNVMSALASGSGHGPTKIWSRTSILNLWRLFATQGSSTDNLGSKPDVEYYYSPFVGSYNRTMSTRQE